MAILGWESLITTPRRRYDEENVSAHCLGIHLYEMWDDGILCCLTSHLKHWLREYHEQKANTTSEVIYRVYQVQDTA